MKDQLMVSVLIATYNHEAFIKDAIEGAIKQETNFNYEIIVLDDASTDQTPEIVRQYEKEYPGFVKGIFHEENQFQYRKCGLIYLSALIQGKYLALCDGDDYWIATEKLQKQVDFLLMLKHIQLLIKLFQVI